LVLASMTSLSGPGMIAKPLGWQTSQEAQY
jgi:hypothetical protein